MNIGYVGSCFAESFVEKVALSDPCFRYFRVNTISLMDERKVDLPVFNDSDPLLKSHMHYENRKNFKEISCRNKADLLVVDFIRDVRCPVIDFGDGYLSFPYELIDKWHAYESQFSKNIRLLHFGSSEYGRLLLNSVEKFCSFVNDELPDTTVLLLDFVPTPVFSGKKISKGGFRRNYVEWSLRYPALKWIAKFAASRLKKCRILSYDGFIYSDDNAKYGPSSVHYADTVWENIRTNFDFEKLGFLDQGAEEDLKEVAYLYLCAIEDIALLSHRYPGVIRASGADIVSDVSEVMIRKIISGFSFDRPPSLVDAFDAFYWILGRAPESIETVVSHSSEKSLSDLRKRLLRSQEFKNRLLPMLL